MSLYKILELEPSASIDDIKKNYRKLSKKYHPDKCKEKNSINKFYQINSAYEILLDEKSRKEYLMLNKENKSLFQDFLEKVLNNNLDTESLEQYGINLSKNDYQYLQSNLYNVINSLNFKEIINFFKSGEFPRKDFGFNNICSDSDVNSWGIDDAIYFFDLPIEVQKHNSKTLKVSFDITLEEILLKKNKSVMIKRQVGNKFINTDFKFDVKSPWVIFSGGGDSNYDEFGDLIIKLNLPDNYDWHEDLIIYQYKINLYQFVYGLSIKFNVGRKLIEFEDWIPSREGNIIFVKDVLNDFNMNLSIKLILNYEDNSSKKNILLNHFNN